MPRPKTNTESAYDVALRFMLKNYGPAPDPEAPYGHRQVFFYENLSLATDAIAFAWKEAKKKEGKA